MLLVFPLRVSGMQLSGEHLNHLKGWLCFQSGDPAIMLFAPCTNVILKPQQSVTSATVQVRRLFLCVLWQKQGNVLSFPLREGPTVAAEQIEILITSSEISQTLLSSSNLALTSIPFWSHQLCPKRPQLPLVSSRDSYSLSRKGIQLTGGKKRGHWVFEVRVNNCAFGRVIS